jgi:DNA-binding MarR family transcriptional regulator
MKATKKKLNAEVVDLADRLHSTAIHLLRQVRVEDRASGIGPAQLSALSILVFGGSKSLKQLAAIEQVKPPTMVRIVQGLVEQRLAATRADKEDGRKLQISATARGRALMQRARLRRVESLARMLGEKSVAERAEIAGAIAILRDLRTKSATE